MNVEKAFELLLKCMLRLMEIQFLQPTWKSTEIEDIKDVVWNKKTDSILECLDGTVERLQELGRFTEFDNSKLLEEIKQFMMKEGVNKEKMKEEGYIDLYLLLGGLL